MAEYEVSGVDRTYGLASKHSVVPKLGVYYERTYLPLILAISSSMHAKVMGLEPRDSTYSRSRT